MSIKKDTEVKTHGKAGMPHGLPTKDFLKIIPQVRDSQIATLQAKITSLTEENIQLKVKVEQLGLLLDRDPLTGAYNRNFLQETATKIVSDQMRTKRSWGVIFIDLDNFKPVNDTHGHPIGDTVLKNIVQSLQCISRDGNFLVRYGGDEFCVLVWDIGTKENLAILAERYRDMIAGTITEGDISVTASIGACFVPKNSSMELMSIVARADEAAYQAKHSGRNCVKIFSDRRKYKCDGEVNDQGRRES